MEDMTLKAVRKRVKEIKSILKTAPLNADKLRIKLYVDVLELIAFSSYDYESAELATEILSLEDIEEKEDE